MNQAIVNILKPSHYQTFDLIKGDRRDSDSASKYALSQLDFFDLRGKSILDIGSNAGYFLFKLAPKGPSKMVGIEIGQKFVQISNDLNAHHYKVPNLEFILGDFFTHSFDETFDFIICFSTFHYFGYKQAEFFTKCHSILNDKGTLLVEIEEMPRNDRPAFEVDPRDPNRIYPNEKQIALYTKGAFKLLNQYMSVRQKGSVYDRWFYEFVKS